VSLATIVSTAVAGTIFAVNPTTPYWVGAALSLLALIPALALPSQLRKQREAMQTNPLATE
jgi:hypothetical protein